jgi:predicted DNA-binding transcriptional regulator YafY
MKINRYFEIIYLLLDRKILTARWLSEHFEVSTRTVYRDIDGLMQAGIPIYMKKGKGGGISLLPNFVLNKAFLNEDDKIRMLTALKAVDSVSYDKNENFINKISSFFGRNGADWIEIDFSSWNGFVEERENFFLLKEAVLSKKEIFFEYSNSKGEIGFRRVEPLKLCYKGSSWYLYAYCTGKKAERFFKLKRIKNVDVSDKIFYRDVPKEIFKKKNMFETDKFIRLKMKISQRLAYRIYDEFSIYKKNEDGTFIGEINFPDGPWLFSYIASFGEDAEVLEPKSVRDMLAEKFTNISKKYL